jgi:hypothetical protein
MRAFSYGTPAKTAGFRLFALGCCVGAQVGHFGARNARVTGRSAYGPGLQATVTGEARYHSTVFFRPSSKLTIGS